MNSKLVKISKSKKNRGFALMEVIVALFLITTGIIGSYVLINSSISSTTLASHRFTAAYLAQEGVELVRNIRDTNWLQGGVWDEGLLGCGDGNGDSITCTGDVSDGCIADYTVSGQAGIDLSDSDSYPPSTGPYTGQFLQLDQPDPADNWYSYLDGTDTKFKRQINIDTSTFGMLQVCVWVGWTERGIFHNIAVRENLYDWH